MARMKYVLALALAMAGPAASLAEDSGPHYLGPDFRKPVFTMAGAPMCRTREGLADLLEHIRAGEDISFERGALSFGCAPVFDGLQVVVLRYDGALDTWVKVDVVDGWPDRWTVAWRLRN